MARFAPVAPIRILEGLQLTSNLGHYHLLLAHDILEHPGEYQRLFHDRRDMVKILDNSVIELGSAVDVTAISKAARIIQADVIILPDVLTMAESTVDSCRSAIIPWKNEIETLNYRHGSNWTFMYVPQGKTVSEWVWAAEELSDDVHIGWWGIPRLYRQLIGSRVQAIKFAGILNNRRKIHLLGFSDDLMDDVISATSGSDMVRGIDSAVPLRCADLRIPFKLSLGELPPRGDWWETVKFSQQHVLNVQKMRSWIV